MGQLNFETQEVNDLLQKVKDMPETVKDGKTPVFETGETSTLEPGSKATLEVVRNGDDESGNPKYKINAGIPRGADGEPGSGGGDTADSVQWSKVLNKPTWVDSDTKPKYTAPEVGALPASTKFKTINGQSVLGEGDIEIPGSGGSGQPLTKEAIEKVFTGNIESHTHNSTYYAEFETDVWDGSTISESLQGTGTKDDPYLIQSCADWLGLWQNIDKYLTKLEPGTTVFSEFPHFVKLNKSLDFNNQPIPLSSPSGLYGGCDVDGCRATISNITIDDKIPETGTEGAGNMNGIAGMNAYCYFHDFNLVNITISKELNIDSTGGDPTIPFDVFSAGMMGDMMNIYANNYIQTKIILSGTIGKNTDGLTVFLGAGYYFIASMPDLIKNLDIKNAYFGASFEVEDNTVKSNNASITIYTGISQFTDDSTITGYFNIPSTLLNVLGNNPVFEEGSKTNIYAVANCSNYNSIFNCSDRSKGFVYSNLHGSEAIFINSQNKTLEELNSDSFINTTLNSLELVFKKGTETPILAPQLKYDGYVRQSEFIKLKEEVRNNAGQGGSTTADYSPYVLPYELFELISQSEVTSEQISAAIGGLDGLKAVINAAKDNRRIVFRGVFTTGVSDASFIELNSFLYSDDDSRIGLLSTMTVYAGIAWINYAIGIVYEKSTKQFELTVLKNSINPD